MDCAGLAGVATELALGVLTGRERAEAVAHLDRCDACREDVRQLMATSEGLLTLLPAREPPVGFETRVLERLGLPATAGREAESRQPAGRLLAGREKGRPVRSRHARRRQGTGTSGPSRGGRRLVASAAVALAVMGAGLAGWGIGTAASHGPAPAAQAESQAPLDSATLLTASKQDVGEAWVYQGGSGQGVQQWMYMSVDLPSGDGTVICQVVNAAGHATTVGSFRLAQGYGAWASAGTWGGTIRSARLLDSNGAVLATAAFTQGYQP
jgi:hypothetical protein